jgi:hypothetical protein
MKDWTILRRKESVRSWLETLSEGPSRTYGVYTMNDYVRWRSGKGLPDDPDEWVNECCSGTVKTLTDHLKVLQEYVRSDEFEGASRETRRKHYFRRGESLRYMFGRSSLQQNHLSRLVLSAGHI